MYRYTDTAINIYFDQKCDNILIYSVPIKSQIQLNLNYNYRMSHTDTDTFLSCLTAYYQNCRQTNHHFGTFFLGFKIFLVKLKCVNFYMERNKNVKPHPNAKVHVMLF